MTTCLNKANSAVENVDGSTNSRCCDRFNLQLQTRCLVGMGSYYCLLGGDKVDLDFKLLILVAYCGC